MWSRLFIGLLAAHITLLVNGCASQPTDPNLLSQTHGYVHATIPKPYRLGGSGNTVTLESISTGKRFTLLNDKKMGPSNYGRWMPAGQYRLTRFELDTSTNTGTNEAESGQNVVTVETATMTDLGLYIELSMGGHDYKPMFFRNVESEKYRLSAAKALELYLGENDPLLWSHSSLALPQTRQATPMQMGLIVDLLMQHTHQVNKPSRRETLASVTSKPLFLSLSKEMATLAAQEPHIDIHGSAVYPAELGQLRVRSPAGDWSAMDTGLLFPIVFAGEIDDEIIACSQSGLIAHSSDLGDTWNHLDTLQDNEFCLYAGDIGGRNILVTADLSSGQSVPHPNPDSSIPKSIPASVKVYWDWHFETAESAPDTKLEAGQGAFMSFPLSKIKTDGKHAYLPTGEKIYRIDSASGITADISPGKPASIVHINKRSGYLTATYLAGMRSSALVSGDFGDSWEELSGPGYIVQDLAMSDRRNGFLSKVKMKAFTSELEFYNYDVETSPETWKKITTAPQGCSLLLWLEHHEPLGCTTIHGSIIRWSEAREWEPEFIAD